MSIEKICKLCGVCFNVRSPSELEIRVYCTKTCQVNGHDFKDAVCKWYNGDVVCSQQKPRPGKDSAKIQATLEEST